MIALSKNSSCLSVQTWGLVVDAQVGVPTPGEPTWKGPHCISTPEASVRQTPTAPPGASAGGYNGVHPGQGLKEAWLKRELGGMLGIG